MVKRRQVVRFLERNGFVNKGGTNHDRFEHPDGRWTIVERHREIEKPMFKLIKKQAGLSQQEKH